jgi:hypothetical protein
MKSISKPLLHYICPQNLVAVISKTKGLRRYPQHAFKCALFVLKPKEGTRVCTLKDGRIEYMPSFAELRSMLIAIDPGIGKLLPAHMRNKPTHRKAYFDALNAARKRRK